ncbi:Transposase (IS4 family) [Stigmatella aurantiaca DW4/3-1]|uniref:Transposase (IS4 family) n=1 Tax=Stigmatella aurantiaca (strain DW4/3-1) TaxID=378806 RepID=E3FU88_STIAD|nr:Transposase (IS4 family) [Stigmatella aurantiaca DW4/3-1]
MEIAKRMNTALGFVVQAKRWIMERTIGWLSRERRQARDYERKEGSCEAFVYLGMIRLMLGRLSCVPWLNTPQGGTAFELRALLSRPRLD